jgi:ribosomal protein S18 acetylase RimI-like enzyme
VTLAIRDYLPTDEQSWLRCRVVAFLGTSYFDDVWTTKTRTPAPGFDLVAVDERDQIVGVLDVSVDGDLATIDTIAVHPDRQHIGIGRDLLAVAVARSRDAGAVTLDAWTRDDAETLRWYRTSGFDESDQYLHVYANLYADAGEPRRAIGSPRAGLDPVMLFLHGQLADEDRMRAEFARVHVCRRFAMAI